MALELNIDGLVGPTHNYSGLSSGNVASKSNHGLVANPKKAALQGLDKMRTLMRLGVPQAIMPPQERPYILLLKQLGFSGNDGQTVEQAWHQNPVLLANLSSASSMWAANAATITPSSDAGDGRVHITPANLGTMQHRSIEADGTFAYLEKAFGNQAFFNVHKPLPTGPVFTDEGAANHNRLASGHGTGGLEIFVYGKRALVKGDNGLVFPARQTLESCEALARRHTLNEPQSLFARQGVDAINAGAFHNDVVCVSNETVLLFHEQAFENMSGTLSDIERKSNELGFSPIFVMAKRSQMSLEDAIASYFFNSQLVSLGNGGMSLILPIEAKENDSAREFGEYCVSENNPIQECIYLDLRESMRNGGGPACLRLRVALTEDELRAFYQPLLMSEQKITTLESWVSRHYRDRLEPDDLGDPQLVDETQKALDELTQILELGSFYPFQKSQLS